MVSFHMSKHEATTVVDSAKVDPYEDMTIENNYTDSGNLGNDTIYLDDKA